MKKEVHYVGTLRRTRTVVKKVCLYRISLPLTVTMSFTFQQMKDIFRGGGGGYFLSCFQKERGEGSAHPFCTCCLEGVALFSLFFKVCVRRYIYVLVTQSCLTLCNPRDPRLLCSWNSPGKNTGGGLPSRSPGDLPDPGSNPSLLHCRQILYHLSYLGAPKCLKLNNLVSFTSKSVTWGLLLLGEGTPSAAMMGQAGRGG